MKILVVSPHPDDETLGAGGLLHRASDEGHELYWLIITHANEKIGWTPEQIKHREQEIEEVSQSYGFKDVRNLRLPPAELQDISDAEIISHIRAVVDEIQPEVVILPDRNDAHTDHHAVFDCCMAVLKTFRCKSVKKILTMEILSESNFGNPYDHFEPNCYVDISEYFDKKIETMRIYGSELGQHPFPRSEEAIKALAVLRGSEAGCQYAEAFHIIKEIM